MLDEILPNPKIIPKIIPKANPAKLICIVTVRPCAMKGTMLKINFNESIINPYHTSLGKKDVI